MAIKAVQLVVAAGSGMAIGDLVKVSSTAKTGYLYGRVKGFKFLKGKTGTDLLIQGQPFMGGKVDKVIITLKESPFFKNDNGPTEELDLKFLTSIPDIDYEIQQFKVKQAYFRSKGYKVG